MSNEIDPMLAAINRDCEGSDKARIALYFPGDKTFAGIAIHHENIIRELLKDAANKAGAFAIIEAEGTLEEVGYACFKAGTPAYDFLTAIQDIAPGDTPEQLAIKEILRIKGKK